MGIERWSCLCWSCLCWSCAAAAEPSPRDIDARGNEAVGVRAEQLIYGSDDRRDGYALDTASKRLALESTAAAIPVDQLTRNRDGSIQIAGPTLGELADLCPSEAFADQAAAARCSAVLVDDRLLLTAGHCVVDAAACADLRWVFGYAITSAGAPPLLRDDEIYSCAAVVGRHREHAAGGLHWDYAFVELDRAVSATLHPVELATHAPLVDDPLSVIGYPSGLPVKLDPHARVLDARSTAPDYFTLSSDTFAGSSGSGVFDASGALTGILIAGGEDYEYRAELGCSVARRVSAGGEDRDAGSSAEHSGERANRAAATIDGLCASGYESARLCSPEREASAPLDTPTGCALETAARGASAPFALVFSAALALRRAQRGPIRARTSGTQQKGRSA
jgi:V8-like Glu-specific endopeptidase